MKATTMKGKNEELRLRTYIAEAVRSVLEDPDLGLQLTDKARRRLAKARTTTGRRISLSEMVRKYG